MLIPLLPHAQLYLLDENKQMIAECDDSQKLGYYSPYDGCTLHIVDCGHHPLLVPVLYASASAMLQNLLCLLPDIPHAVDPYSASAGGWLEDVSLVQKYEISEEAYNARENTYRNFKAKKLAEDPNVSAPPQTSRLHGRRHCAQDEGLSKSGSRVRPRAIHGTATLALDTCPSTSQA